MSDERIVLSRRTLVGGLSAVVISSAVVQGSVLRALAQDEKLKVAFVYVGPVSDDGWTKAHDDGRKAVEAHFGDKVETAYIENIPETPSEAERAIREFAQKGYKLIFTTSFGFMDPTFNVAKDFPDTIFVHISGYKTAKNMGTGFAKIEEPRYVTGLIAGKMTKTNKIGYVAAFGIPEVVRGINSFTLGVRKANPAATVKVVWTNTWFDPQKERQAADALLDGGVDVTAQHQDSPATLQADEAKGVYGVGYDSDMSKQVPKAALTSPIFIWAPFYIDTVQKVMDGTWETSQFWGGWKDGVVDVSPYGAMVPDDVKKLADDAAAKFKAGDETIFTIFTGPLKDNKGAEKVTDGKAMTGEELLSMNWFVEGVEGEVPEQ
ncbi:MAG: BMP family ABC transporter substrate-binding protein [Thermomicrobiales bacterium]